jgi:tRNA A-37 threonylcarbamoyl transferase component Bud32
MQTRPLPLPLPRITTTNFTSRSPGFFAYHEGVAAEQEYAVIDFAKFMGQSSCITAGNLIEVIVYDMQKRILETITISSLQKPRIVSALKGAVVKIFRDPQDDGLDVQEELDGSVLILNSVATELAKDDEASNETIETAQALADMVNTNNFDAEVFSNAAIQLSRKEGKLGQTLQEIETQKSIIQESIAQGTAELHTARLTFRNAEKQTMMTLESRSAGISGTLQTARSALRKAEKQTKTAAKNLMTLERRSARISGTLGTARSASRNAEKQTQLAVSLKSMRSGQGTAPRNIFPPPSAASKLRSLVESVAFNPPRGRSAKTLILENLQLIVDLANTEKVQNRNRNHQKLMGATPFIVIDDMVVLAVWYNKKELRMVYRQFQSDLLDYPEWTADAVLVIAPLLEVLHKSGVYHRDIKPDNILVDTDTGRIALCDFGFVDSDPVHERIRGSPAYMPPPVLAFELTVHKKDVAYHDELKKGYDDDCIAEVNDLLIMNDIILNADHQEACDMVRAYVEEFTLSLDKPFTWKRSLIASRRMQDTPKWYLDCYALGMSLFSGGTFAGTHASTWPWKVATSLMAAPKKGEKDSQQRLTFAVQKLLETKLLKTNVHLTLEKVQPTEVPKRFIASGSFGEVYRILDNVGMAMYLCKHGNVKAHCYDLKTKKIVVYDYDEASTGIKDKKMICEYHSNPEEAKKRMKASCALCYLDTTNAIYPCVYPLVNDEYVGVVLLGLQAENGTHYSPMMLVYNGKMEMSGVNKTLKTLVSLRHFLQAAHCARVVHGKIRDEVLVEVEGGAVDEVTEVETEVERHFGIVGFTRLVSRLDDKFFEDAFQDQVALHNIFSAGGTIRRGSRQPPYDDWKKYKEIIQKEIINKKAAADQAGRHSRDAVGQCPSGLQQPVPDEFSSGAPHQQPFAAWQQRPQGSMTSPSQRLLTTYARSRGAADATSQMLSTAEPTLLNSVLLQQHKNRMWLEERTDSRSV